MKSSLVPLAGLLAGALLVSCTHHHHHPPPPEPPPPWTQSPKANDSVNLYRIGTASGELSAPAAREAAYQDALRQITRTIEVEVFGAAAGQGTTALTLNGAEIMPGCSFTLRTPDGYAAWVQVSFPLTEKIKLVESLKK